MTQTNFRQWNEQPTLLFDEKWKTGMAVEFGNATPEFGIIRLNMGSCLSICVACGSGTNVAPKRSVHVIITPNTNIKILEDISKLPKSLLDGCKYIYPSNDEPKLNISHTIEKRIADEPPM